MTHTINADQLLDLARQAADRAYAPYSQFPVGAALITSDGRVFQGANIENASYGLGCCAERTAVFQAVLAGADEVIAIAVWAPRAAPCSPCGACRQVLVEWRPREGDMAVILEGQEGPIVHTLESLIPYSFGPRDLAMEEPS
ncbi:MAG: cytidine deaminase [Thermomicrobiales bacterium]